MSNVTLIGEKRVAGHLFALALTLVSGTLFGVTVAWTPGATSLADGAVTIEYDEGSITRLAADVQGAEKLVVTSDGAMPFAADADVVVSNGTLRFEAPIHGAGALNVLCPSSTLTWDAVASGRNDYLPDQEANAVVVATGVPLDAFAVVRGTAGMLKQYYYGAGDSNVKPYWVVRGEGTLESQMQHLSDTWNKCITLKLKQRGADIVAWTPSAVYANYKTVAPLGTDFRTIKYTNMGVSSVAAQRNGYGLDGLTLTAEAGLVTVEVANGVTLDGQGTLTVGTGLTFIADGPKALAADGVWNTPVQINGTFRLADPYGVALGGAMKFGTYGRCEGVVETAHPTEASVLDAPKWPSGEWQTFATNVLLEAVADVTAKSGGGSWFDSGNPVVLNKSWFENDGQLLTVQLAKTWDGTWLKGVVYQVRQSGNYLQHRILRSAAYGEYPPDVAKLDLRKEGQTMDVYNGGANGKTNGYGLQDIQLHIRAGVSHCGLTIRSKQFRSPRGVLTFEGRADSPLLIVCDEAADLPENLTVGDHVQFAWNGSGVPGTSTTTLTIEEKGVFAILRDWQLNRDMTVNINGGTFDVFPLTSTSDATSIYLENVNFTDGGRIGSNIPRVGYYRNPVWTVRGTKPAFTDKGIGVVGNGDGAGAPFDRAFILDVADVTASADPDFTVNGNIYYSNRNAVPAYDWAMAHVVKTGSGTVRHNGVLSVNTYPFVISNGTWQVTRTNGIVAGCDLELSGGTLALDDACTLSLGSLAVGGDATSGIALGAGSRIAFADVAPAEAAKVEIRAEDPVKAVRVGTGRGLTAAQLRCLSLNGESVHQDAEGYICMGPYGMTLLFR